MQILTPLQRARFIYLAYPYGVDMLSLMAAAAREAMQDAAAAIFQAVLIRTGGFEPSGEWRQVLLRPLRLLHCET